MESRIFLIGFMGSGKTTLGKIMAKKLGYQFIDLDHIIESSHNLSIGELFAKFGEQAFRKIEQQTLQKLSNTSNIVVATGGGTPCFYDNTQWMNANGITVFLDCTVDDLFDRLKTQQAQRPLIKGFDKAGLREFIQKKLEERRPFYNQALIHVYDLGDIEKEVNCIIGVLGIND